MSETTDEGPELDAFKKYQETEKLWYMKSHARGWPSSYFYQHPDGRTMKSLASHWTSIDFGELKPGEDYPEWKYRLAKEWFDLEREDCRKKREAKRREK